MNDDSTKHIYWIDETVLEALMPQLEAAGITLGRVDKTVCQTLNAAGQTALFAPPEIWSGMCRRQGSWYRESDRQGLGLLVSAARLPECFEPYLDVQLAPDDFQPDELPTPADLEELVDDDDYQRAKPEEWEQVSFKDRVLSKLFFTVKGFWGWGDNMRTKFLGHRANHANFLSRRYTTERDGEDIPYSVTNNAEVCSSCVEFFNVIGPSDRKLVRACPGSVVFAGLERETYYDVVPVNRLVRAAKAA